MEMAREAEEELDTAPHRTTPPPRTPPCSEILLLPLLPPLFLHSLFRSHPTTTSSSSHECEIIADRLAALASSLYMRRAYW
jgi:hypothetical protein